MRILITGKHGQLGNSLKDLSSSMPEDDFIFTDKEDIDLTDLEQVRKTIMNIQPEIIINCAGYTAVDQAEDEPSAAHFLNGEVVGLLASLSAELNALFIHISTDYVFDGKNFRPYEEDDTPSAPSIYGQSKIEGEENILMQGDNAVIIRTSWLYSQYGKNFVKTMLRLGQERDELKVIFDQVGTPTYATDLARAILEIVKKRENIEGIRIYNFSNEGAISWYDFAKTIMELKNIACTIKPIQSHEFPAKAPRPFYSVLNKARIKEDFELEIPYWKDSLKKCLAELAE